LIVGVSLAFQSAHAVHARVIVVHGTSVESVHAGAPWYIAMNAGHRGQNARPAVDFDLVIERS
jgi:hypothetical protein